MKHRTSYSPVHSRDVRSALGVKFVAVSPKPASHQLANDQTQPCALAQPPTPSPQFTDGRMQPYAASLSTVQLDVNRRLEAWLAKYTPIEQQIYAERERRLERKAKRQEARAQALGDLAEATGGLSKVMFREDWSLEKMMQWADGDVFMMQCLARIFRKEAARKIDAIRHQWQRSRYYPQENERRRTLAAARRSTRPRSTSNPCPTREAILDAWIHLKDSHAATIRFGSLIEDLACYLDSSLCRNEEGVIVGRNPGVKGWLQENIPALFLRYTTVMRYKSAARKLKQLTGIDDPIPAEAIVCDYGADENSKGLRESEKRDGGLCDYGADEVGKVSDLNTKDVEKAFRTGVNSDEEVCCSKADEKIRRAREGWHKVITDLQPYPTPLLARIDKLLGSLEDLVVSV